MRPKPSVVVALSSMSLAIGCSSQDPAKVRDGSPPGGSGGGGFTECSAFEELVDGACVDPIAHREPEERVDVDNVVDYSDTEGTVALPPPPKSGFRLVVPPQTLAPGEEVQGCVAWEYPELTHDNIYAARLYTTGMLHHSNMYGVPIGDAGPSDYPSCALGQSDVFSQVAKALDGVFMDVLFANSTQVEDGEAIVFPDGMAFPIVTDGREVVTSIHWLNTSSEEFTSEVVYDFYTMPDEDMEETLVPFVYHNQGFTIPPQTIAKVTTTCDVVAPGNIVAVMPHTHQRATNFTVDLFDGAGEATRIYEAGPYNLESDIHTFDEPVSLEGFEQIQHECTVDNELDQELVHGVGVNEMCILFGYMYPPEAQQLGFVLNEGDPCTAMNIGQYR